MAETEKPLVRPAAPADMKTVWDLLRQKAAFDRWLERMEATPEKLSAALFAEHPLVGMLLAELDGRIVGFSAYYFTFSTFLAKRCVWVDDMFVLEGYRRRGVGKQLLIEMVRVAKQNDCGRIEWVTTAANDSGISFYESLGARVRTATRLCRMDGMAIASLMKTL